MKTYPRPERRRMTAPRAIRVARGTYLPGGLPGSISNESRELPLRQRSTDEHWWRRGGGGSSRDDQWGGEFGARVLSGASAARGRERRLTAMHICNAPGCSRRAMRPCFDCGEWRCEEHLHAAVHHRKSAIVHLCPNCLHAHVNAPDRLRLEGFEDERAERAADPLAPRETRRDRNLRHREQCHRPEVDTQYGQVRLAPGTQPGFPSYQAHE